MIGVFFYGIIVTVYYLYMYYNNFHEKLIKEAEFKTLLKEAELKSLKYQINPHFIFNSLNSISSLTMINPDKAREMTIKLSEYLRSTLANNENQKSLLKEEIKNSRLYLDIEKVRFGDRFEYFEDLQSNCSNILVPSMVIQPLLENAIKYGVYESLEKVTIKLHCLIDNNYLKISLENEYDGSAPQGKGEKIGLKNIKEQLRLMYNQDNLLTVEKNNNIFKVNLFIPLDTE
jgi:LytS/YehU family sensor histidine kinase